MKNLFDIDRYSTSRAITAPTPGKVDYITAGNGLYKRAVSDTFLAMVPIIRWPAGTIPSLPDLEPTVISRYGQIPPSLLIRAIYLARGACSAGATEAMYHIRFRDSSFYLSSPRQERDAGHVGYTIAGHDPIIMDIHSHHTMRACFSDTDDRDELGLQLYGVLGQIHGLNPQIAIRVGVYGTFYPLRIMDVFAFPQWCSDRLPLEDVAWT